MLDKKMSWEYQTILTEVFGRQSVEIYEYQSMICVRINGGDGNSIDIIMITNEQAGWEFFNKLLDAFALLVNSQFIGLNNEHTRLYREY